MGTEVIDSDYLENWLFSLTPFEEKLKSWYEEHGELASNEQVAEWVTGDSSIALSRSIHYQNDSFPAGLTLTLDEMNFIDELLDVSVLRHPRYYSVSTHDHKFFEIVYVLSGSCRQTIFVGDREEKIALTEGNFLLIAPMAKHSIMVNDDSIVLNILLRKSTFNEVFFNNIPRNTILSEFFTRILYTSGAANFILFRAGPSKTIREAVNRILYEYISEGLYKKEILNMHVSLLLMYLLRDHSDSTAFSEEHFPGMEYIPAILQYIERNYAETSVQKIADHFGFSLSHISRLFRRGTQYTLCQALILAKMQKAQELLNHSSMPVSDIASSVGFHDITNFIRRFKETYHTTPAQYRKIKYC
jgi:AraC-like DNA-binding protein